MTTLPQNWNLLEELLDADIDKNTRCHEEALVLNFVREQNQGFLHPVVVKWWFNTWRFSVGTFSV